MAAETEPPEDAEQSQQASAVPAGPATRRLARELGIDLSVVRRAAASDRVTQEDVLAYARELTLRPGARVAPNLPPLPDFSKWGKIERQPLDVSRRTTAEQTAVAWSMIPHGTHHDVADITELERIRQQQDSSGSEVTITAFALKAAAKALQQFPRFNATLDLVKNQLILKRYYHLGVAVDTERGLQVPVLRDVDKKTVHALAKELGEIADRARQNKLSAEEMRGGTFTVVNIGSIGGTALCPVIHYLEVAILGLARIQKQQVWADNGQVATRWILPLSLSYDQRVIDAAEAARFVHSIVESLENPLVMLVQG